MKNFDRTLAHATIVLKRKFCLTVTASMFWLTLEGVLTLSAKGFNQKNLETVLLAKDCVGCDLSGADLIGRDLSNIVLRNANLSQAKLGFANLKSTDLSGTNLSGAELFSAFLFSANLRKANLQGAILMGAYLHKANLEGANLSEADVSRAFLFDTNLKGADLKKVNFEGSVLNGANFSETNLSTTLFKETLYDQSTLFPNGFSLNNTGLVTSRPSRIPDKPDPDRHDIRLAERHQLSQAASFLMWVATDEASYGGCQDQTCYDLPMALTEKLLKLDRELFGEKSPEVTSDLFLLENLRQLRQ